MATKKKLLQAAAGSAGGGEVLNVEDVFTTSTYRGGGLGTTVPTTLSLGEGSYYTEASTGSLYFPGEQNVYVDVQSQITLSGDFTVEAWVYNEKGAKGQVLSSNTISPNNQFALNNDGTINLYDGGSEHNSTGSVKVQSHAWNHVAWSRTGTTVSFFINGQAAGTSTVSASLQVRHIGCLDTLYGPFEGRISGLRVVNGTGLYTAAFTPPSVPLSNVTNTVLLACQGTNPLADETGTHILSRSTDKVVKTLTGPSSTLVEKESGDGLIWIKKYNAQRAHTIVDTVRGTSERLQSNNTNANATQSYYAVPQSKCIKWLGANDQDISAPGEDYVSWTWKKQENFFDIVTYVGDRTSGNLTLNHNLGSVPGMIIIKCLDDAQSWSVYHRSQGAGYGAFLNSANAFGTLSDYPSLPTSTEFTIGTDSRVNFTGRNYVAYIFAHHDGDGTFGENQDEDIIHCGSFTSSTTVNIGFEPQFLLLKRTDSTENWFLLDTMRGLKRTSSGDAFLEANTDLYQQSTSIINLNGDGFETNLSGTYAYMAIRRPSAIPTNPNDVFTITPGNTTSGGGLAAFSPFVPDMFIDKAGLGSNDWFLRDRGRGFAYYIEPNKNGSHNSSSYTNLQDRMNGVGTTTGFNWSNWYFWLWKRAPKFFDLQTYIGTSNPKNIPHCLGVAPELMIVKNYEPGGTGYGWKTYSSYLGPTKALTLNESVGAENQGSTLWDSTAPTETHFRVGTNQQSNQASVNHLALLFASLEGVSKVGNYTGNGATSVINIDCGFTSEAQFVLIKRTDSAGDWYLFDAVRGIYDNATDESYMIINSNAGYQSNTNYLTTYSSGFGISTYGGSPLNVNNAEYIFYAIASD